MACTLNSRVSAEVGLAGDRKMAPLVEVRLKDGSTASSRAESALAHRRDGCVDGARARSRERGDAGEIGRFYAA